MSSLKFHPAIYLLLSVLLLQSKSINSYEFKCPTDWQNHGTSCYQFVRYPQKTYEEAAAACARFNAHLLSVLSVEEHKFITDWLRQSDPVHQSWYTSAQDTGSNAWRWNVPIHVLSTTGATSSIASASNGIQGALGPLDPNGYSSGRSREFFSILATIWLPQDMQSQIQSSQANQFPANQQQSIIDSNRGQNSLLSTNMWDNRNARNAVYK